MYILVKKQGDGDEVEITIRDINRDKKIEFIPDSSPPTPNYINSSNVELNTGLINLIQRNIDFVNFI